MVFGKMAAMLGLILAVTATVVSAAEVIDSREVIYLNQAEKHHVLTEMRLFLTSVQQIIEGVTEEDITKIVKYAKKSGKAGGGGAPSTLRHKLPKTFKLLGSQTHMKFDQLALDTADLEDPGLALQQLSTLMKNCLACHSKFRIELSTTQ